MFLAILKDFFHFFLTLALELILLISELLSFANVILKWDDGRVKTQIGKA
jgi:hypothetical protein